MTHSLDLLFYTQEELPGPPLAQIYVKTRSKDRKGHILITPRCFSLREVEAELDRLKDELESIRKKAKRKFANIDKQQ